MQSDLSAMSVTDLRKFSKNVVKEIEKRVSQSKQTLIKEVKKLCAKEGIEMSELLGVEEQKPMRQKKTVRKAKAPAEPVYFHQADPSKSWSGRGRKPEWVNIWIENGGNMEDLKKKPY